MKQRTKALLAGVISGAAFAGLVGGLILWLPSYKQKKEVEAIKPVETAAPIIKEPEATPDPATEEAAQRQDKRKQRSYLLCCSLKRP